MATYCIGDIHGCYNEFMRMLELVKFDDKKDELLLTGDLIGRGPYPVETMTEILKLGSCVTAVAGNHDLNFLAAAYKIVTPRPKDNIEVLINSKICDDVVHYLSHLPLLYTHKEKQLVLVHAGIYPLWDLSLAKKAAKQTCKAMRDETRLKILLENMYSNEPDVWSDDLEGLRLWRFALNVFTRMRLVYRSGVMDFKNTAISPELVAAEGLFPWFSFGDPGRSKKKQYTIVFGHWAALGAQCQRPFFKALDTGCVWGDRLSCWCFDNDKHYQVKSVGYTQIKPQAAKV